MAKLVDSRRVPGVNLFGDRPGAVLDLRLEGESPAAAVEAWTSQARRVLREVGWDGEETAHRLSGEDLSLFLSGPRDALYAATEVNELAWASAEAVRAGSLEPELQPGLTEVRRAIRTERKPALVALADEAARRGVAFLPDDESVSVGTGAGCVAYPIAEIPPPADIPWERVRDVPTVMVTGTNGKSTTVRLLGAITRAWGKVPGVSTTDGLVVGNQAIGTGDYSGPEGARKILRDPRVEVAVLETARGGIQRRGLALTRVDAAAITNVAEDHIGEFGIHSLEDIADLKMVVARALKGDGVLVLNAGDPLLIARAKSVAARIAWFTADDASRRFRVEEIPLAFGGAARHNLENAMTAALLGDALGIPDGVIARGLASFRGTPEENPGRLNVIERGGVTVVLDYAHNPHGMDALVAVAKTLPAQRRLILLGQAGDRDDEAIRALARSAWALGPDLVVIKEMEDHLRGRAVGEIPAVIEAELRHLGARDEQLVHAASEVEGVQLALGWARPGDQLVLTSHASRRVVLDLLR